MAGAFGEETKAGELWQGGGGAAGLVFAGPAFGDLVGGGDGADLIFFDLGLGGRGGGVQIGRAHV